MYVEYVVIIKARVMYVTFTILHDIKFQTIVQQQRLCLDGLVRAGTVLRYACNVKIAAVP